MTVPEISMVRYLNMVSEKENRRDWQYQKLDMVRYAGREKTGWTGLIF